MKNKYRTTLKSFGKGQGKDKHFQGQKQIIFTSFFRHPKLFPAIVKPSKPKSNE
jgi:hypothetical protein